MADPSWAKRLADILRRNDIHLFATVPDYIVCQVLETSGPTRNASSSRPPARRKGSASSPAPTWAGTRRAADAEQRPRQLRQHAGSLNVASQIPVVLVISHRGDLGEFNPAQVPMGQARRHPRPLDIRHVMPDDDRRAGVGGRRPDQARLHALAAGGLRPAAELTGGKSG